jgi:hypothetical protein
VSEHDASSLRFPNASLRFKILVRIFSFLDAPHDLIACSATSRLWKPCADHAKAWEPLAVLLGSDARNMGHGKVEVRLRTLAAKVGAARMPTRQPAPARSRTTFSSDILPTAGTLTHQPIPPLSHRRPRVDEATDAQTAAAPQKSTFSTGITSRAPASHGSAGAPERSTIRVVEPRRTVDEELEAVTHAAYRQIGARPLTVSDHCDILEEHKRALALRLRATAPQLKSVAHNLTVLGKQSDATMAEATALVLCRRDTEGAEPKLRWAAAALPVRDCRWSLFETFERRCTLAVLHNTGGDRDRVAAPATMLTTFAQLEMLCSNPRNIGGPIYMRWALLKRTLPLTDAYYDVRDGILDPATFDVDEYVVGRLLGQENATNESASGSVNLREAVAATIEEITQRRWPGGVPVVSESLIPKILRVVLDEPEAVHFESLL